MIKTQSMWQGRRFTPLWFSQFFSALNDNLFRFGLNAALIFGVIVVSTKEANSVVSLSPALFIFPYLVISGVSGQLADKYSKSTLLRWNRGVEIFVFALSAYALSIGLIPLLIVCLIMVGALAAFYGPVKLAITPELVEEEQLIAANGAIESGTYAAILLGTLIGTALMAHRHTGPIWTIVLIMLIGIAAWVCSLFTPDTPCEAPDRAIDWNVPAQSWQLIKWGAEDRVKTILLMGNGWFWFVGTAVLSGVTLFVKDDLHSVPELNTLFLALFACGVGLGSWLCNYLLQGRISLQFGSRSAVGMGFCALLLSGLAYLHPGSPNMVMTLSMFMSQGWAWLMMAALVGLAAFAGLFVVPMVTMMQTCVPPDQTAKLLSLSNIWFAVFIIAGALMSDAILQFGGHPKTVFAVVGALSLVVAALLFKLLPGEALLLTNGADHATDA